MRLLVSIMILSIFLRAPAVRSEEVTEQTRLWEATFEQEIRTIIQSRCIDCHGMEDPDGELNLARFESGRSVSEQPDLWDQVGKRVRLKEMPPEGSPQLNDAEKASLHRWLDARPGQNLCDKLATDETQAWYRGYVMSRRLTRTEYLRAIHDLTGIEVDPQFELPSDGSGGEGFDTVGASLFTSPIHVERYLAIATDVMERAIASDATNRPTDLDPTDGQTAGRWIVSPGDAPNEEEAARRTIGRFARRAWRRPASDGELDRLMQLYRNRKDHGAEYLAAVSEPLKAILVSPHFLFVIEPESAEGGVQKLTPHQLATRLALFLWSSVPDEILLDAADQRRLESDEDVIAQTRRMMADPRADALGSNFGLQWLGLTNFSTRIQPDQELFPEYTPQLANDLRQEAESMIAALFREDRSILELIDADHVYINGNLAAHYAMTLPVDSTWQRVPTSNGRRGGVVTLGAVLMSASYPRRTSPVLRGRWILEELLGGEVPPPPPNVPALDETHQGDAVTLRQRLELHRTNPECASCHNRMDPLGFGLENFDLLGRWRELADGLPIDASGKLPSGEAFQGPEELKQVLMRRSDEFENHFVRKMIGFALGRELNKFDDCVIEDCLKAAANSRASIVCNCRNHRDKFSISTSVFQSGSNGPRVDRRVTSAKDSLARNPAMTRSMPQPGSLSRRRFLRGSGVLLGMPWFASLADRTKASELEGTPPLRTAFLYFPNGVWEKDWVPLATGRDFDLPATLTPLEPIRHQVSVLSGLDKKHSHEGDGHYAKTANFLTGMPVAKTTGKDISSGGISVDQLIASRIGDQTPLPSLELGTEPVISGIDSNVGYTRLYGSHISWETPSRPVAKEINPRVVYDRLFGKQIGNNPAETVAYQNLLDFVLEDARSVRKSLGRDDQFKMDEYLDASTGRGKTD